MIRKVVRSFFIILLSFSLISCSTTSSSSKFDSITDEFFKQELSCNSLNLHFTLKSPKAYGITDCKNSLGDFSPSARKETKKYICDTLKALNRIRYKALDNKQKVDFDVFKSYLETEQRLSNFELYQEPMSPSSGIQVELPLLLSEYRFYNPSDIDTYLKLLSKIGIYYEQILSFEQEKADAGLFMNDNMCVEIINSCEKFIDNPKDNLLISTFNSRMKDCDFLTDSEKKKYIKKNIKTVEKYVVPSYTNIINTFSNLLGKGKNDNGLCNFKDGKDYYQLLAYRNTGCSDSIEKIIDAIDKSRADALNKMKDLVADNPSLSKDCESYQWPFENENDMLKCLRNKIIDDFPKACDCNCNLCFVDDSLSDSLAPAFYITAPIDDYKNNIVYINDAKDYSDIKYFTTLAHESFPGHLYQTVMSYSYGLSPFRSLLNFGGYTEGWATYVEMLSYKYAGLDDAVAEYLMLNQIVTLSLYASSDIGIHYQGWDYKDMCDFWKNYGVTDENSIDSIMNYIISEPTNYLKYYVGYLQFKKLKATEDNSMAFHEAILKIGPAPFDIVKKYLDTYKN